VQDRPTYTELLEAVQAFLENDVVPALEGPKKFHARVAANVLAIVRREIESTDAQCRAEWERLDRLFGTAEAPPADRVALRERLRARSEDLCARIRRGDADSPPWRSAVLAHVRQTVIDKLAVANPKYLGAEIARAVGVRGLGGDPPAA
jgi:uncharacterized protein DUF6285